MSQTYLESTSICCNRLGISRSGRNGSFSNDLGTLLQIIVTVHDQAHFPHYAIRFVFKEYNTIDLLFFSSLFIKQRLHRRPSELQCVGRLLLPPSRPVVRGVCACKCIVLDSESS